MQASKTRDDLKHYNHFECQHCGTVITEAPRPPDNKKE
jgi:5-methylcytosine-specific restriction endonuclease McrA